MLVPSLMNACVSQEKTAQLSIISRCTYEDPDASLFFAACEGTASAAPHGCVVLPWFVDIAYRLFANFGTEQRRHNAPSNTHCPDHSAYKCKHGFYNEHRLTNGEI